MAIEPIYKETGRATYDEIRRIRQRLQILEARGGDDLSTNLVRPASTSGPVGGFTTVSGDLRYLRLDASNDPVTGALSLSSGLSVAGATDVTTLLASGVVTHSDTFTQVGLSTFSDMIHSEAPASGVANLRMDKGTTYNTLSPDASTLSGHDLWFVASSTTASDGGEVVRWDSEGAPFSGDGFTKDTTGPVLTNGGGPNSLPAIYVDGGGGYLDTGSTHVYGGAGTGATVFIVYRPSTSAAFAAERAMGGSSSAPQRSGVRPPGTAAAGSAEFSIRDKNASGAGIKVSQTTLSQAPLSSSVWQLAVFRKDTSDVWHPVLNTVDEGASVTDTVEFNIEALFLDKDQNAGTDFALAEVVTYAADLGLADMKSVYNYLAEKYALATYANGAGAGAGGGAQTDYWISRDSAGTVTARLTTDPKLILNTSTYTGDSELYVVGDIASTETISAAVVVASRDSTTNNARIIVRDEIGTSNLNAGYDIRASDDSSKAFIGFGGSNNLIVENKFGNNLSLYTNASERLRIDGSGNIFPFGKTRWNDNVLAAWGSADDATLKYDGTDLVMDPKAVGSGVFRVQGVAEYDQKVRSVSTHTTMATTDKYLLVTGTAVTNITLASAATSRKYTVKNVGTFSTAVVGAGGSTIDGATTHTLTSQYDVVTLIPDGTNWFVV